MEQIVFRFALAVFKQHERALVQIGTLSEMHSALQGLASRVTDYSSLAKVCSPLTLDSFISGLFTIR